MLQEQNHLSFAKDEHQKNSKKTQKNLLLLASCGHQRNDSEASIGYMFCAQHGAPE